MKTIASADGTAIAFEQSGDGPAVILVSGGSVSRSSNAPLADLLAAQFTVYNYDRRGRGPSGDTQPYAPQREVEDIAAVVDAAGGSAFLYGSSSGAALALMAATLPGITRLALWEPPFILDPAARPPADAAQTVHDLVAADRRGDAAEYFMARVVGLPPEFVAHARTQPWWAAQEALAHTLEYDVTIMGDYSLPEERLRATQVPTLVIDGADSAAFMHASADAAAALLPRGQRRTLSSQNHNVAAPVLAPVLAEFFR